MLMTQTLSPYHLWLLSYTQSSATVLGGSAESCVEFSTSEPRGPPGVLKPGIGGKELGLWRSCGLVAKQNVPVSAQHKTLHSQLEQGA